MPYLDPKNKRKYNHEYYIKNRDKYIAANKLWHSKNKRPYKSLREPIFEKYGAICNRCGFSDKRALQIDHVNGGGCKEIRKVTNRRLYYRLILADKTGKYQILCANCNWIKKEERKEFNFTGL